MRRKVIYRLSFRLTGKDIDLLWLDADEKLPSLSVLVKKVLQGIVSGKQEVIPLPTIPQKRLCTKTVGVRFYRGEDDDIVAWLQNIEKGSRGLIVKSLLRHAMEIVDFRPYMINKDSPPIEIRVPEREYDTLRRPFSQQLQRKLQAPIEDKHLQSVGAELLSQEDDQKDEEENDDWFSAFEKMSHQ